MQIRVAHPDDVGTIRDIVWRAYEGYVPRIGRRPAPMDDDYRVRVSRSQVSVAVLDDQLVGLIVTVVNTDHLLIDNVAVEPAYHGRGVGRALLGHAEVIAVRRCVSELRLYTNIAMTENLSMYPRLGYREIERRTDSGFDRVFFAKRAPNL